MPLWISFVLFMPRVNSAQLNRAKPIISVANAVSNRSNKYRTRFWRNFMRGGKWPINQPLRFWWRSGSEFWLYTHCCCADSVTFPRWQHRRRRGLRVSVASSYTIVALAGHVWFGNGSASCEVTVIGDRAWMTSVESSDCWVSGDGKSTGWSPWSTSSTTSSSSVSVAMTRRGSVVMPALTVACVRQWHCNTLHPPVARRFKR